MAEESQWTGALGGAGSGAATGAQLAGPWGAAVGGVIGGVTGFFGGGGEDEAEEMAEEQARNIRRAARENDRRGRMAMRRTLGESKARTYASNILDNGSSRAYRNQLETEAVRDLRWNRSMAEIQAEQVLKGGKQAAGQIKGMGRQSALAGLTSLGTAAAGGAFSSASGPTTKVGDVTSGGQSGSLTTNPFTKKVTDRTRQSLAPTNPFGL